MSGSAIKPKSARVAGNPQEVQMGASWPQVLWVNELTGFLMVDAATTDAAQIQQAEDKVVVFNHLDAGTCRERISTIVTSSATLGITLTETFSYNLVNGKYVASGVTQVVA